MAELTKQDKEIIRLACKIANIILNQLQPEIRNVLDTSGHGSMHPGKVVIENAQSILFYDNGRHIDKEEIAGLSNNPTDLTEPGSTDSRREVGDKPLIPCPICGRDGLAESDHLVHVSGDGGKTTCPTGVPLRMKDGT